MCVPVSNNNVFFSCSMFFFFYFFARCKCSNKFACNIQIQTRLILTIFSPTSNDNLSSLFLSSMETNPPPPPPPLYYSQNEYDPSVVHIFKTTHPTHIIFYFVVPCHYLCALLRTVVVVVVVVQVESIPYKINVIIYGLVSYQTAFNNTRYLLEWNSMIEGSRTKYNGR